VPTLLSHPAAAIAAYPWFRSCANRPRILAAGALLTLLPDLDGIGLRLGIPYGHMLGHRGLSHSLFFAALTAGFCAFWMSRRRSVPFGPLWAYFGLCLASHGLLDALTDGGYGIAFLAPFSERRFFFPVTPIEVSPLSPGRFFSGRGMHVLQSEMLWVWCPALAIAVAGFLARAGRDR
jgi:inner membrane protein